MRMGTALNPLDDQAIFWTIGLTSHGKKSLIFAFTIKESYVVTVHV